MQTATKTDEMLQIGRKVSGEWKGVSIVLRFFPDATFYSGSMEWLSFAPVSVKRMDYFLSILDRKLRLKLQNNQGEENFQLDLVGDTLVLYDSNGNDLNFAKICDA